jgi:hypothetical protein
VPRTIWSRSGDADHDLYGTGVTTVGDLDLDGALDVAVSGTQSGYGVSSGAGYVDVLSGRDGTKLFRLRGNSLDAQFGRAIAGLGDVDADGRPDFAIGAPVDSIGGVGAGAVRIVRGFPLASTSSCPSATANSTGAIARLVARGSGSQSAPALFLELTQAPPGRPAVFFRGNTVMQIPFGNGVRCAGGQLLRISAAPTGTYGALVRPFDVGPIPVGTLLVFQAWFDDAFAGGAGFNASDAAIVVVAP